MLKKIRNFLVEWVGSLIIQLIGPTLRMRVRDESGLISNPSFPQPVIFAFWHNRMFLMSYFYRRFLPGRRGVCLVSASQDGEMIALVLGRFGLKAVRGSSSRRGKEAFRELTDNLKEGWDVAITPDGPRGPCYQAHIGVVGLAALSGSQLVPVSYDLAWKFRLPSWDRFIIPIPFSICSLHLGKPMSVASLSEDKTLEQARNQLEIELKGMENSILN